MSLKDLKPRMFCTVRDVVQWSNVLAENGADGTRLVKDNELEYFIYKATETVKLYLFRVFDLSDMLATPYCGIPIPDESNTGSAVFFGASAGSSAYTENWTVSCATSTFSITGSLQGSKGSGSYASGIATTDISIGSDAFSTNPTSGDKFYIGTYDAKKTLVFITSMLAAGYALNSKYTEDVPNASSYGVRLEDKAIKILERFSDPTDRNSLAFDSGERLDLDIEPIAVPYEIDETGTDVTDYYSDRPSQEGETALPND